MPAFKAEVVFYFESESIEAAGRELRRLAKAAGDVAFEMTTARVEPRPPNEQPAKHGTPYAPLDSQQG